MLINYSLDGPCIFPRESGDTPWSRDIPGRLVSVRPSADRTRLVRSCSAVVGSTQHRLSFAATGTAQSCHTAHTHTCTPSAPDSTHICTFVHCLHLTAHTLVCRLHLTDAPSRCRKLNSDSSLYQHLLSESNGNRNVIEFSISHNISKADVVTKSECNIDEKSTCTWVALA